jgi:hypothetical protein
MPRALQLIAGTVNAAGAGFNTVTASPGDSFTVAAGTNEGNISLEQIWAAGAVTDMVRVYSPRMHDNVQGIRVQVGTTKYRPLLPWDADQPLYPADTPTVQTDATGAGQTGVLLMYEYMDLPGANQRLATWEDINPRIEQLSYVEVDVTSSATVGTYGAGVAINANNDNFKANRDYAWLGYTVNAGCLGIGVIGPDTSNYRIGGAGDPDPILTKDLWRRAAMETGRAFIPIIAANNKGATLVQAVDVAASTAVHVTLALALLKQ